MAEEPSRQLGGRPDETAAGTTRLAAGATLGNRFRIHELIGRGGMSEVYRATDLSLDQEVALKLIAEAPDTDPELLEALLNEVRLARGINHPNVCRVHDTMQFDGFRLISMEFVPGQSLETLLRQVGRLSHDTAVSIARQLCAGLAAAHDAGVIHCDLKPSNVLIDRDGHARIIDFGLAVSRMVSRRSTLPRGTTSYMAPEQLASGATSERSDIYSLGLVLYRMFTGREAIEFSDAVARAAGLRPRITPSRPSTHVPTIDPAVERVILACLQHSAERRPPSARAVGAGLPGSDTVDRARAAGELLDPSLLTMVQPSGPLSRRLAATVAGLCVVGALIAVLWAPRTQFVLVAEPDTSAPYLAQRARDLGEALAGVRLEGAGRYLFDYDRRLVATLAREPDRRESWGELGRDEPDVIDFRFEAAPGAGTPPARAPGLSLRERALILTRRTDRSGNPSTVEIRLDSRGRLREFHASPSMIERRSIVDRESWIPWIVSAGIEPRSLRDTDPLPDAFRPSGRVEAWTAQYPGRPEIDLRVEAVSSSARPVSFRVIEPWEIATVAEANPTGVGAPLVVRWAWLIVVLAGAGALAMHSLRHGRADRRHALRVAVSMFGLTIAGWFADDLLGYPRLADLRTGLASAVYFSFTAWLFYVALEPRVRRVWPEITISWMRLLDGRTTDSLVGRDVLIGTLFGVLLVLSDRAYQLAVPQLGGAAPRPDLFGFVDSQLQVAGGFRYAIGEAFWLLRHAIWGGLGTVLLVLLLQLVVRNRLVAIAGMILIGGLAAVPDGAALFPTLGLTLIQMLSFAVVLFRFGFLSVSVGLFAFNILSTYPLTFELSAWYGELGTVGATILAALVAWGAIASQRTSGASRPT